MIEINLLPESMRRPEGTPLPRFIVTCLGLVMVLSLLFFMAWLQLKVIPQKERELAQRQSLVQKKEEEAQELDKLDAKITAINNRVENVKSLFLGRRIWAKVLWDLKHIITLDQTLNEANPERRYLWIDRLTYSARGDAITITGYASATSSTKAMRIVENLIKNLRTYSALERPEKLARQRLEAELKLKREEWRKRRQQDESLPPVSEEIKKLEAELAKYKNAESGMVALTPFYKLFKEDGIKLLKTSWTKAPGGGRRAKGGKEDGFRPDYCHKFSVIMTFKPVEEED